MCCKIVFDECIVSRKSFSKLEKYHEEGKIELKKGEKVQYELKEWEGEKGKKYNEKLEKYDEIGNLSTFDDKGLKFPFSFFDEEDLKEIRKIILHGKDINQIKPKNRSKLERDVRNVYSAVRFKADFFVTDDRHIISKKKEIEKKFGLKIFCLDEMIKEMKKNS